MASIQKMLFTKLCLNGVRRGHFTLTTSIYMCVLGFQPQISTEYRLSRMKGQHSLEYVRNGGINSTIGSKLRAISRRTLRRKIKAVNTDGVKSRKLRCAMCLAFSTELGKQPGKSTLKMENVFSVFFYRLTFQHVQRNKLRFPSNKDTTCLGMVLGRQKTPSRKPCEQYVRNVLLELI